MRDILRPKVFRLRPIVEVNMFQEGNVHTFGRSGCVHGHFIDKAGRIGLIHAASAPAPASAPVA